MKTLYLNNNHNIETFFEQLSKCFYYFYNSWFFRPFKKRVKNEIPTSEENPEAFALFAGICKSEKFTIDVAGQAFSGVVRKKKSDYE